MKKEDKVLYTCESIVDGYEYKKMAKYFPKRMYWVFVIRGTILNIIITALIALISQSWIVTLIFFVVYEIYLLIFYKIRLESVAEKAFNARVKKKVIATKFETEFYDEYLIRKSDNISITINYSEIDKVIENDTNFYLEYPKMNSILIFQKNDMDNELISFIRKKFENIDNKLGDKIKFKNPEKIKNPETIEKLLTVLFVITLLCIYGANFAITKVLEINNTDDTLKYIWITWLFLPIPIASIILGYKYKKRGIRCTKNIVAGFIVGALLLIYGLFYVIPFDDIIPNFDNTIVVVKKNKGHSNEFDKYLVRDGITIYLANNIRDVYYEQDKTNYKLKDYIMGMWQSTEDGIKHLTDHLDNTDTLKDGGTKIYKSSKYNITIITCNTINGNNDIYIGDYNTSFDSDFMCE